MTRRLERLTDTGSAGRTETARVSIVFACLFVATVAGQVKPDFSGSWTRDETRSTSKTDGRAPSASGASVPLGITTIRQTATDLTISNEIMGMSMTYAYKFDGSESVNHNGAMTQTTRSHWNGAQLVTEGKETQSTSQGFESWTMKATRALDAKGELIVDMTSTNSRGVVTTTHQVFTKKSRNAKITPGVISSQAPDPVVVPKITPGVISGPRRQNRDKPGNYSRSDFE